MRELDVALGVKPKQKTEEEIERENAREMRKAMASWGGVGGLVPPTRKA